MSRQKRSSILPRHQELAEDEGNNHQPGQELQDWNKPHNAPVQRWQTVR